MTKAVILAIITTFWLTVCVVCSPVIQQSPEHLLRSVKEKEANLSCYHGDGSYTYLYWYQQKSSGGSVELIGMLNFGAATVEDKFKTRFIISGHATKDAFLLIPSISAEDSAVYFCAASRQGKYDPAYFGDGTKLTVLDPAISKSEPIVKILNATKKESCKKKITLVCLANNFYPDHVKVAWFVGQQEITEDVATDPHATLAPSGGLYTISSRLKVSQKMWKKPTNKFTCKVSYYNGSFTSEHSDFVYGVAGGYDRDSYVKSSQWMKLAYGVTIAKSGLYGLVIFVFVWRKGSNGK